MKIISHRGNIDGPSENENTVEAIHVALDLGFDVEVDTWFIDGFFYLGHDAPENMIDFSMLDETKIWFHAKNLEAAERLMKTGRHVFWHQNDDFAITNKGFFWTYPGKELCRLSVAVLPETSVNLKTLDLAYGVCTDFPIRYIAK